MSDANKVRFGLSQVHYGTYTVASDGTVTLGSPVAMPGAVSLNLDPDTAEAIFYADNDKYHVAKKNNGYTGELVMAKFPDSFKTTILNYIALTGGGIGESKKLTTKAMYLQFQVEGDVQDRRTILYNVEPGSITANPATTEDNVEVTTETLPITVVGDNKTGLVKSSFESGDTGYSSFFSTAPVPALPVSQ